MLFNMAPRNSCFSDFYLKAFYRHARYEVGNEKIMRWEERNQAESRRRGDMQANVDKNNKFFKNWLDLWIGQSL